jgi:Nitroreductase
MNTYDAIFSRKSIKHFQDEKLDWEVISDILEFANRLPMLIDGISVEFKLVSNIESKQGFNGPFHIKAPYYICISSEEKDDYLLNAGYLMQQLNLYIVGKGYGTCFIMGTPGHALKSTMKYKYIFALAFGKTSLPLYRDSTQAKRLPEKEVVLYKEEVPDDIKQLLSAARLSPSSLNNQPWRFVVYKNRIHIFARKNPFLAKPLDFNKMVDMGIMMANLLLAAEELWIDVTLCKSDMIKSKQFHSNEYIRTLTIA